MDIRLICEQAFRNIQSDPDLWKQWNQAKEQAERNAMMFEQVYRLGVKEGLENPYDYGI